MCTWDWSDRSTWRRRVRAIRREQRRRTTLAHRVNRVAIASRGLKRGGIHRDGRARLRRQIHTAYDTSDHFNEQQQQQSQYYVYIARSIKSHLSYQVEANNNNNTQNDRSYLLLPLTYANSCRHVVQPASTHFATTSCRFAACCCSLRACWCSRGCVAGCWIFVAEINQSISKY